MSGSANFRKLNAIRKAQHNNVDILKPGLLNYRRWSVLLSYYRYYMDRFITDIFQVRLFPFQKYIVRAISKSQNSTVVCSRGLGKTFLLALFACVYCVLYPGVHIGIVSKTGKQARSLIIDKIKGELMNYPNIANEIERIDSSLNDTNVRFKNGSKISSITLGQTQGGDSARGKRCHMVIVDEARLVKDSVVAEVVEPMTNNLRPNLIFITDKFKNQETYERNKMVFMSSAYLKTCDFYKRFVNTVQMMRSGNANYFAVALDYKVGEECGIFFKGVIESKKDDPMMTIEQFIYEYEGTFVGSSNESYYPYEITQKCRVLQKGELQQPKNSQSEYILTHDIAVSGEKGSDNCSTHIIKLKPKSDGTFIKEVVYTKTHNHMTSLEQRDYIRELYHIRFPNITKIVIDERSVGEGLKSLLCESWIYTDEKGVETEYPPLILDNDPSLMIQFPNGKPVVRGVSASAQFNTDYYSYTKSAFESGDIKLLIDSNEVDNEYKTGEMNPEEYALHLEHDFLMQELSNITEKISDNGTKIYTRIVPKKKRDRVTSLIYGLSYVHELEIDSKARLYNKNKTTNWADYIKFY